MKRWITSAVMALAVAVGAFAIADAQDRAGRSFGFAEGGPGRGPGGRGFGLGPIAGIADLTDAQREQIKTILETARASRQATGSPAGMALHHQLRTELLSDAPDDAKIETLRQQIAQATADSLAHEIDVQRKIAQVLTPEQRAAARERLAQGGNRRGRGRLHP